MADKDRRQIRSDAKRLYERPNEDEDKDPEWVTIDPQYKNRDQAKQRAARDGLAYATTVMPKHYSSIHNVLQHVKQRFGPHLKVTNILDMSCHVGEVLWSVGVYKALPTESLTRIKGCTGDIQTGRTISGAELLWH